MIKYVMELLQKRAIVQVSLAQKGRDFYSPLFLVRKKTGEPRPILGLKRLNRKILVESFKIESLQSILLTINTGDWMLSIDLSDAYLHVR